MAGIFICIILFVVDVDRSYLSFFVGINLAHCIRELKSTVTHNCVPNVLTRNKNGGHFSAENISFKRSDDRCKISSASLW